KKEDLDKEDENLKKSLWDNAKRNVRLYFIIEKIAMEEKLEVEESALSDKIAEIARNTKQDPAQARKKLEEKGLMENLKEQILHDKVVEFLLREAKRVS
ncbi:MAG: hypothetical protein ABH843_00330, partial [Candidatus Omnitrophota bacterium]